VLGQERLHEDEETLPGRSRSEDSESGSIGLRAGLLAGLMVAAFFVGYPIVWVTSTLVALGVVAVFRQGRSRWHGLNKMAAPSFAVLLVMAFVASFALSGGYRYAYGGGGSLELTIDEDQPPRPFDSLSTVSVQYVLRNGGGTIIRVNPGYFPAWQSLTLHFVGPDGATLEARSLPPPVQPRTWPLWSDTYVEIGPHESFATTQGFPVFFNSTGRQGPFVGPGSYIMFLTFESTGVGPSSLPCWTGILKSNPVVLILT